MIDLTFRQSAQGIDAEGRSWPESPAVPGGRHLLGVGFQLSARIDLPTNAPPGWLRRTDDQDEETRMGRPAQLWTRNRVWMTLLDSEA